MFTFILVWFGQLVSLIGSGLTHFALGVWLYQTTGSATQFSLVYLFAELPYVLIAPFGGAIADRYNRRWVMILADSASGFCTLAIMLLMWNNWLQLWQIYFAVGLSSAAKGFQEPTYYSIPTLLVPKQQFGRANGMIQLGKAAEQLFSPILAGVLVNIIQVHGIILIDFVTFGFAMLTLLFIRFPTLDHYIKGQTKRGSLRQEMIEGWHYLVTRPGLLMLLMFFVLTNFTIGLAQVLITPMVLGFTTPEVLGRILSLGGSGWLFGAIWMSTWSGFESKVKGMLGFEFLLGFAILIAGLRPSATLITLSAFIVFLSAPIIISSHNSIWQIKVEPKLQGRVFALRGAIAWSSFPLAYLVAGPLADYIFQPLLMDDGLLANSIGQLMGTGSGRGIGLLFVFVGAFVMLITILAYQFPRIRQVEDELPDY